MTKQLISILGGIVCAGILLLAIVLGVMPQVSAGFATLSQAGQVSQTNAIYQQRITHLQAEQQNLPTTKANVARLHAQIPASAKLNNAFEVISRAATTANATVVSITADDPAVYTAKAAPTQAGLPKPAAAPNPKPTSAPKPGTPAAARTQYPITIDVTVKDAAAASKFLDGLRAGPRVLANITSTATEQAGAIDLKVDAMAFADQTGVDK